ncbi:hypothetical protein [Arenimonas aestuarii]
MKPLALISLIAGLALAALPGPASAQVRDGLELSVTAPAKARLMGDTEIVVSLTNTGPLAINLPSRPGWDAEGGLTLSLTEVNGARMTRPVQAEEPMRGVVRSRGGSTMVLEGEQGMDFFHVVQLGDLIKSPGTYRLEVAYRRTGQAELISAPVEIVVSD